MCARENLAGCSGENSEFARIGFIFTLTASISSARFLSFVLDADRLEVPRWASAKLDFFLRRF